VEQPPPPVQDSDEDEQSPSPEALAKMLEEIDRRVAGKE
jgi:hypothetical protein